MGYELRRQLADTLPAGLSSGERLVALELADQANDRTRLAYGRGLLALVARRCGLANEKQVGKVLGKLAKRGIEFRVQVERDGVPLVDKRGRPVFAFDGRETSFRIPAFGDPIPPPERQEPPPEVPRQGEHFSTDRNPEVSQQGDLSLVVVTQQGDHSSTGAPPSGRPQDGSGPPLGSEWSPARGQVVPPAGDPSPHFPSGTPQDQSTRARERQGVRWLWDRYRLTDDQATAVIETVRSRAKKPIGNIVRYLERMTRNPDGSQSTDLLDIVEAVQTAPAAGQAPEVWEPQHEQPLLELIPAAHSRTVREALRQANPAAPSQPPLLQALPDIEPEPPARPAEAEKYLAAIRRRPPHSLDPTEVQQALAYLHTYPPKAYLALCKQARAELGGTSDIDAVTLRAADIARTQHADRRQAT